MVTTGAGGCAVPVDRRQRRLWNLHLQPPPPPPGSIIFHLCRSCKYPADSMLWLALENGGEALPHCAVPRELVFSQGNLSACDPRDGVSGIQVLCSVKRPSQALQEMRRVLRDRGRLLFVEHVLAPPSKPGLRLAQRLLDPLQQFASDGCRLVRDTLPLVCHPPDVHLKLP